MRSSAYNPAVKPNDSDRAYFQTLRASPRDELGISPPLLTRPANTLALIFARKLTAADGSVAGVVTSSIIPRFLSAYFRDVDLGRKGTVVLIGEDGVRRARAGGVDQPGEELVGRAAKNRPILAACAAPEWVASKRRLRWMAYGASMPTAASTGFRWC